MAQKEPFWLGGAASMGAAMCTHPIDLLKVRMQTQRTKVGQGQGLLQTAKLLVKEEGAFALYNGLSASLLRQATYSTVRFGAYEKIKVWVNSQNAPGQPIPLYQKIASACLSGAAGGIVGTPADVMNVRMQADGKLPVDQRRNYSNAISGLARMYKEEGLGSWFRGIGPNVNRAMLMTAGQLASYDQIKQMLLDIPGGFFVDGTSTHLLSSVIAGFIATLVTQPFDVVKTRMMNAGKVSEFRGAFHCLTKTAVDEGVFALFKGFVPALTRLAPQTVLTFIFLEQLRVFTMNPTK
eukprot:TRINITY_DN2176_c0_g1_i1.p1 TRINITY_DN2176_c0_g1~~TRINITY_DN2176_c0_g1_i1.p1  ORF type:complete len:294 (-),score=105.41 TRINITY_DN2176_c0_g1_i1:21-902(-)